MISELSKFPYVHLEDICNINIGKTPSRSNASYWGKGFTWISISDMNGKEVLFGSKEEITELGLLESGIKTVKAGSLLFSFKLSIGKVAFAGKDLFTNEAIAALEVKDSSEVDPKYLYYVLKEFDFTATGDKAVKGITLNKAKLKRLKIPLPPLSTQQQIARILDQADALRKKTQQVIDLYDQLAQSTFLDMFGDPVRNPKGWQFDSIKAITTKIGSGATPKGGKESYISEGISLIRSLNVHDGLFKMKDLAHISDIQAKKLNNVTVEEEDVLLNITGASVCRCTIVPASILPARVNQHVAILRCKKERLNPAFLLHTLISDNSKMKLMSIASKGGATREALTKEDIEKYTIPLPPITLQNQFAEKISLIEKQKELAKQSLQESENLFNALLQKAFKGELVNSV
jgi:type I restriction enzyme, S subunit